VLAVIAESSRPDVARSLDVPGALLVTGGLVALVYGIVSTDTQGWTSVRTVLTLAVGVVLLAAFLLVEGRLARTPLMPLRLFRSRSVSGANLVMLLLAAALMAGGFRLAARRPILAGVLLGESTAAAGEAVSNVGGRDVEPGEYGPRCGLREAFDEPLHGGNQA